jgi:hypothetical protein
MGRSIVAITQSRFLNLFFGPFPQHDNLGAQRRFRSCFDLPTVVGGDNEICAGDEGILSLGAG